MFRISRRKRLGMRVMASATRRSNRSLLIFSSRASLEGSPCRCLLHDMLVIIAVVAHRTLIAQRLRLADAASVKNLYIGSERPHFLRQRGAELLLDLHGVVAFCDADPIGDPKHMAVDGKA